MIKDKLACIIGQSVLQSHEILMCKLKRNRWISFIAYKLSILPNLA